MDKRERGEKARKKGSAAENAAVLLLQLKGYKILERNFKPPRGTGAGEIDIIALKHKTLVFVEVKQRKTSDDAAYSIDGFVKKRRIAGARYFLMLHGEYETFEMRFDAVLFGNGKLPQHIKNAWECD